MSAAPLPHDHHSELNVEHKTLISVKLKILENVIWNSFQAILITDYSYWPDKIH